MRSMTDVNGMKMIAWSECTVACFQVMQIFLTTGSQPVALHVSTSCKSACLFGMDVTRWTERLFYEIWIKYVLHSCTMLIERGTIIWQRFSHHGNAQPVVLFRNPSLIGWTLFWAGKPIFISNTGQLLSLYKLEKVELNRFWFHSQLWTTQFHRETQPEIMVQN